MDIPIKVLLACHNRKSLTERLLGALEKEAATYALKIEVFAVDDGSIDGTLEMLENSKIVKWTYPGDGTLYWAASMAKAESEAVSSSEFEAGQVKLLWINDDVDLYPGSISRAVEVSTNHPNAIVIGSMRDEGGQFTYGGLKRRGLHPLSFEGVSPIDAVQSVETFNGNFVLVPAWIAKNMGQIDAQFSHGFADIDYGLRAKKMGFDLIVLPFFTGTCNRNLPNGFKTRRQAWREYVSVKGGGNFRSLRQMLKKRNRFWLPLILLSYSLWWFRRLPSSRQYTS
jgi:GT2 family glycosyltransferase